MTGLAEAIEALVEAAYPVLLPRFLGTFQLFHIYLFI